MVEKLEKTKMYSKNRRKRGKENLEPPLRDKKITLYCYTSFQTSLQYLHTHLLLNQN